VVVVIRPVAVVIRPVVVVIHPVAVVIIVTEWHKVTGKLHNATVTSQMKFRQNNGSRQAPSYVIVGQSDVVTRPLICCTVTSQAVAQVIGTFCSPMFHSRVPRSPKPELCYEE